MKTAKILYLPDANDGNGATAPTTEQRIVEVSQQVISALSPFASLAGPDGAAAIVAAQALLKGYELMVPYIEELKAKGLISAEQQASVYAQYTDVKTNLHAKFTGPNWVVAS